MCQSDLFPPDTLTKISGDYNPIVFVQRLPRHQLLMKEIMKYAGDEVIFHKALSRIKAKATEINEKKRVKEITVEFFQLLKLSKEIALLPKQRKEAQKKALQIFVENLFYLNPAFKGAYSEMKAIYPLVYQKILPAIFNQIEELKLEIIKQTPEEKEKLEKLKIELNQLKANLNKFLEYEKKIAGPISSFGIWAKMSKEILAAKSLKCDGIHLCLLMPGATPAFVQSVLDLLKVIIKKGGPEVDQESQQIITMIEVTIQDKLSKLSPSQISMRKKWKACSETIQRDFQ